MRRIAYRILCLTLALLLALPCVAFAADAPAITLSSCPSSAFRDPYSGEVVNKGAGTKAVCGQHTYVFPGLVNQTRARDLVARSEAVFAHLAGYGMTDRPLTIYTAATPYTPRVSGDQLYLGLSCFNSMDYVTALTQLAFGTDVVYGLLYALSRETATALGLSVEELPDIADALPAFEGDGLLYADMNYACFTLPYTDAAMQSNVKALAWDFFHALTREEQVFLLTNYANEAFYPRLNEHLASHSLPMRQNASLWGYSFFGGGPAINVCWESPYASFAVFRSYDDLLDPQWYGRKEEPLTSSYADLLYWVERFEGTLGWLHARFAPYIDFRKPAIFFDSANTGSVGSYTTFNLYGYYMHNTHTIHIGSCEIVDHEYVHALTIPSAVNANMNEVLAYTYGVLVPEEWSRDLYEVTWDYAQRSDRSSDRYDPDWFSIRLLATIHLGHMPDLYDLSDMLVLMDVATLHGGHTTYANLREERNITADVRAAKISFYHYLMRTWGEGEAILAILQDDPATRLGFTWEGLVENWIAWLKTTYGDPALK